MTPTVEQTIAQYVASWNDQGAENIRAAFAKCWAPEATYTDPNFALVKGVDGLTELAVHSYELFPGRSFHVHTQPEHHHNCGRYTWSVDIPGQPSRQGYDFFEFNDEHLIVRLVSFFGTL